MVITIQRSLRAKAEVRRERERLLVIQKYWRKYQEVCVEIVLLNKLECLSNVHIIMYM